MKMKSVLCDSMEDNVTLRAVYETRRQNLLIDALRNPDNQLIPSSFLYAIYNGVYPLFDQTWHTDECDCDPFDGCYNVSKEFIEEVSEWIATCVNEDKDLPTYYEMEKKLGGKSVRVELMHCLRYIFLSCDYEEDVFKEILAQFEYPTEASSIVRLFSVDEIFLA